MLDRRDFSIGVAAAVFSPLGYSASAIGVSGGASLPVVPAGIAPIPVHALQCCNPMVQENARRLARMARELHETEHRFAFDPRAREAWPRLYEAMIDEAWGLREKGIMGRSPLEMQLLDWVGSIFADEETRARRPRVAIQGLSSAYDSAHIALEHHLSAMARQAPHGELHHKEAIKAAWRIANLVPETLTDLSSHRLAVEVLYSNATVFERRYRN